MDKYTREGGEERKKRVPLLPDYKKLRDLSPLQELKRTYIAYTNLHPADKFSTYISPTPSLDTY